MANNKIRKYANAGRVKGGKGIAAAGLFGRLSDDAAMLANQRMGTKFQDLGANKSDIIKMENGNWTGGEKVNSVDRNLMLMNKRTLEGHTPESELKVLQGINEPQFRELHTARQNEETDQRIREATHLQALNKWINGNLKNYIKKQMATPSDPVRLMMDKRADEIRAAYVEDRQKGQEMLDKARHIDDPRKKANLEREVKKFLKDAEEHRNLALENIGHMTPREMREHTGTMATQDDQLLEIQRKRAKEGMPTNGVGRNKSAQAWEQLTDLAIAPTTKQTLLNSAEENKKFMALAKAVKDFETEMLEQAIQKVAERGVPLDQASRYVNHLSSYEQSKLLGRQQEYENLRNDFYKGHHKNLYEYEPDVETLQANPFIEKLDPEQKLYNIHKYYSGNDIFGMDKVVDALKKDLTAGKIRPEQLNKLTVEQAVERVGRQRLKAAQEEKEARLKFMANMPVYKEYPEEGYRWVQLDKPGQFAQESDVMGHSVRGYEPPRDHPENIPATEGGHRDYGLGGYEAIKSGKAKIYSLRDAAGNSHATIEVKQPRNLPVREYLEGLSENEIIKFKQGVADQGLNSESSYALMQYAEQHPDYIAQNKLYKASFPPDISQIKGKQNEPVHEDYLKYVQDFVQSGKFNEVNDLHNADLRSVSGIDPSVVSKLGLKIPKHLNEQQIRDLNEAIYNYRPEMGEPHLIPLPESIQKFRPAPEEGMKQGGPVAKSHHYHQIARDFDLPHLKDGGQEGLEGEEKENAEKIRQMFATVADLKSKDNVIEPKRGIEPSFNAKGTQDFGNYSAGLNVPFGPVDLRAGVGSHFGRGMPNTDSLKRLGFSTPIAGGHLHVDAMRDPKIRAKEFKVSYERHFANGGANHYQDPFGAPDSAFSQEQQDSIQDLKDAARNMYYNDKRHLVSPKNKKDFGLQVAANYAGIPVDTVNWLGGMAAEGLDATVGKALGKMFPETFTRPVSVLNPNGERVLAHPLADKFPDSPRGGSRDLTARLGHDYEFASAPLVGGLLDLGAPALVSGVMRGAGALNKVARATPEAINTGAKKLGGMRDLYAPIEGTAPDLGQGTTFGFRRGINDRLLNPDGGVDMRTVAGQRTTAREGVGTYKNLENNMEINPMTNYRIPNAGAIGEGGNAQFRKQMGQAGVDLNQEAMAAYRFTPLPIQRPTDATSILIRAKGQDDLHPEQIKQLADRLGHRMAIAHNPQLGGLVAYPYGPAKEGKITKELERARKEADRVLGAKSRHTYGHSDFGRDRMYLEKPEGHYEQAGAGPANPKITVLRDQIKHIQKEVFPNDKTPSGGLQHWSRGPEYPTHVQGIGNGERVQYRPANYASEEFGPIFDKEKDAEAYRSDMQNKWHRTLPNRLR